MSKDNKKHIQNLLNDRKTQIEFYESSKKEDEFGLEIRKIEKKTQFLKCAQKEYTCCNHDNMKWFIQIEGENFVLEELSKSLNFPDLSVFQEEGNYFLKCDDFNILENAEDVFEKAKRLVPILSGTAQLYSCA